MESKLTVMAETLNPRSECIEHVSTANPTVVVSRFSDELIRNALMSSCLGFDTPFVHLECILDAVKGFIYGNDFIDKSSQNAILSLLMHAQFYLSLIKTALNIDES